MSNFSVGFRSSGDIKVLDLNGELDALTAAELQAASQKCRDDAHYQIIICGNSYNLEKELNSYVWDDKKAGIPVDSNNHLIDAMRYAYMDSNSKNQPYMF